MGQQCVVSCTSEELVRSSLGDGWQCSGEGLGCYIQVQYGLQ
jgi:hypothetical protein